MKPWASDHPLHFAIDLGAALAFAVASAFAGANIGGLAVPAGAAAFVLAYGVLRAVTADEQNFPLPVFETQPIDLPPDDELLLDDVLAAVAPDSRVVRLFSVGRLPSAGELQARVERHLAVRQPISSPPDASLALSDALAELRRSLR